MSEQLDGAVILGMHRSGTSAATRLVNMLGLSMCRKNDIFRGPWNPTGHWESIRVAKLDERMIAEMGCRWWYPPPAGPAYHEWAAKITTDGAFAAQVFNGVHEQRPWVWKDPRACLLVPFWRSALHDRFAVVLVVRHPLEVAESLQRRNQVPLSFGVALWQRYNRLALEHVAGLPVLVSRYEDLVGDPAHWCEQVAGFLASAGIAVRVGGAGSEVEEFVDPGQRHSVHSGAEQISDAAAMLEAIDSGLGPHTSFQTPALGPEPASVERELARYGPDRVPSWRPPPWASRKWRSRRIKRFLRTRVPTRWFAR